MYPLKGASCFIQAAGGWRHSVTAVRFPSSSKARMARSLRITLRQGGLVLNRVSLRRLCHLATLVAGLMAVATSQADALSAVQVLREGGCGGTLPAAQPLHHNPLLDRAAEQWAAGSLVTAATQ